MGQALLLNVKVSGSIDADVKVAEECWGGRGTLSEQIFNRNKTSYSGNGCLQGLPFKRRSN